MDIPDALYRRVRSRSALEGSTLRAVTITLYTDWLSRQQEDTPTWGCDTAAGPLPAWAGLCAEAITKNAAGPHDMPSIRKSIASAKRLQTV